MQLDRTRSLCHQCPARTPLRPDPDNIQRAQGLDFEPPLDEGIRDAVHILISAGVETYESCEGGDGHSYPEPTIRFEGSLSEGFRALAVALAHGLPVRSIRQAWGIIDGTPHGPWWEITFAQ
jgi:hypothetical protein